MRKMTYIFIVCCLLVSNAFGYTGAIDTYITEFPIFVNGDVASIENSFKFVNKLFADSTLITNIVLLSSLILTIATGLNYVKTMTIHPVMLNTGYMTFGVMSILGALNVTVHIEDQRTAVDYTKFVGSPSAVNYAKVDDIPFPIAAIVSVSSTISYTLLEKVNDATVDVDTDGSSYSSIGFAKGLTDAQKVIKYARFGTDTTSKDFENAFVEYTQTCLLENAYYNGYPNVIESIRNPKGDVIKQNPPSKYGIENTAASFKDSSGVTYSTCNAVYGFLTANYATVANTLETALSKVVTSDTSLESIGKITKLEINDTLLTGAIAPLKTYMVNAALIRPLTRGIRNSSATSVSGQELANEITFESSKAKLQAEGLGQYKWMAEMLPLGYHFFMAIIYSSSAFVFIFALAMGYQKGMALISNFAQGLLTFEFIQVAMALANNTVNQYSKTNAASQLTLLGDNLASLDNINYHLDYLATMTGIAGILGVSAVFIIPTIVFTGKVAVAAGAIGGLSGKYKGNDIEGSMEGAAETVAKRKAFDNIQMEKHALEKAGMSVPTDMSQGDFYNKLQSDLNATSKGLMAASQGSGMLGNASIASGFEQLSNVASAQQVANTTGVSDNISHGSISGAKSASDIEMSGKFIADEGEAGFDSLRKGNEIQSLRDKYSTAGMGNSLNYDDAKNIGTSSASMQAEQDKAMVDARQKTGLLDDNGYATGLAKQSMANKFVKESAEFAGVGRAELKESDIAAIGNMGRGKFDESVISAGVYSSKAMNNGALREDYVDALKGSEASKIGSMIATTKGMGGSERQEDMSIASSFIKAKEDIGSFQGKLQEAGMSSGDAENFGKKAGESFTKSLEGAAEKLGNLAQTKSGAQTRSDFSSVAAAGGDSGYRSLMATQAVSSIVSSATTIDEAEKPENGGYMNFIKKSAREKVSGSIATLDGKTGKLIDETGSLTTEGRKAIVGAEGSKANAMLGTTRGYGGPEKQADAGYQSALIKASEDAGALRGKIIEGGGSAADAESFGRKAGDAFVSSLDKVASKLGDTAQTKQASQTRSDIRGIEAVGKEKFIENSAVDAESRVGALNSAIEEANKKRQSPTGYQEQAKIKAAETMGASVATSLGMNVAGTTSSDGSYTIDGMNSVIGSTAKKEEEGIQRAKNAANEGLVKDIVKDGVQRAFDANYAFAKNNLGMSEEKSKEYATDKATNFAEFFRATDENGEKKGSVSINNKGQLNTEAYSPKIGADFMKSLGEAEGNTMTDKMGKSTVDGMAYSLAVGTVSAAANNTAKIDNSTTTDSTTMSSNGVKINTATTAPELVEAMKRTKNEDGSINWEKAGAFAQSMSNVAWNADYKNQLKSLAANAGVRLSEDENGNLVEGLKSDPTGGGAGTALAVGSTALSIGLGGYALNSVTKKLNSEMIPMTEQDMKKGYTQNEDGSYTDKHGDNFKVDEKGNIRDEHGNIQTKYNENKNKGILNKTWESIGEKYSLFKDPSENISNSVVNKTGNSSNNQSDNPVKNDITEHDNPPKNSINESITQNENKLNQSTPKSREVLNNAITNQIKDLDKNSLNMSSDEWAKKMTDLESLQERVNSGKEIHSAELKKANIDTKALGLDIKDKGFVDFDSTEKKINAIDGKKAEWEKRNATATATENVTNGKVENKIDAERQEAVDRWLEDKKKSFDGDTNRGNASIEKIDSLKGTNPDTWSDVDKEKLGFNSTNTQSKIEKIEAHINDGNAKGLHGIGGKVGAVATAAVLGFGIDSIASDLTGEKSIIKETSDGEIAKAALKTAELFDPTFVGVQTLHEQGAKSLDNISQGKYLSATGDLASIPHKFASNLLAGGFNMGQAIPSMIDRYHNEKSVMDGINQPAVNGNANQVESAQQGQIYQFNTQQAISQDTGMAQQLQSQMSNYSMDNSMQLMSGANTMHMQSIGGEVNIGQNNAGMTRINGMQTQLPYSNFQAAMQNNSTRNAFASMVSGVDMNNGNSFAHQNIHSVDGLMDQMQQRFNTQEYMAIGQRRDVNMMGSYAEESFEKMEDMMDSNDSLMDRMDELQRKIEG